MKDYLFRKFRAGVTYAFSGPEGLKRFHELRVWETRLKREQWKRSDRYEYLYTEFFGLDKAFYSGKRILDIGCGPRGSLEWADMASIRVGLDPFAHDYRREFGTHDHNMLYVTARGERIPFEDECFDIVSSFMSLKHIIGVGEAINEITRVLAKDGVFLLHTSINFPPNNREPTTITWAHIEKFCQDMRLCEAYYRKRGAQDFTQWSPQDPILYSSERLALRARLIKA